MNLIYLVKLKNTSKNMRMKCRNRKKLKKQIKCNLNIKKKKKKKNIQKEINFLLKQIKIDEITCLTYLY